MTRSPLPCFHFLILLFFWGFCFETLKEESVERFANLNHIFLGSTLKSICKLLELNMRRFA